MSTDSVRCGCYLPTDGYLDPALLTNALVDGAARAVVACSRTRE